MKKHTEERLEEAIEYSLLNNGERNHVDKSKEYKTSLITSAVTGKIDVRNWKPKKVGKLK